MRIDISEPSLTALFNKGQVGLINLEFRRMFDAFEQLALQKAELAAENERLTAEVEWLRKADRLVCWNPTTQQWEVRHEALK